MQARSVGRPDQGSAPVGPPHHHFGAAAEPRSSSHRNDLARLTCREHATLGAIQHLI